MPETLTTAFFSRKRILACVALLGILAPGADALAQMSPNAPPPPPQAQAAPPPPSNPVCVRLEAQLAMIDRGGTGDPARDDQIRRYQDTSNKQQAELERGTLTIAGLLEPVLILAMGLVVLLIVLAVLMPIIEINQLVQ